jgi:hypothetical protein
MNRKLLVIIWAAIVLALPLCAQDPPTSPNPPSPKDSKADKDKRASAGDVLQPQSRAWILRGLTAEWAVARKALPRGTIGLHLGDDGAVDERSLQIMLANGGPAVHSGERTQVTKIEFKKDSIVLALNGGVRKRPHFTVDTAGPISGGVVQQQQESDPTDVHEGCYISLDFKRPIPDLTVEDVKQMLAPVLDFNQRSVRVSVSETWPAEVQEAVKKRTIIAGMTKDQVLASKGKPDNKIRELKGKTPQETWVYGVVPAKVLLVIFEQDEVVEAREYIPGIPATKVPRPGDPPDEAKPEKP